MRKSIFFNVLASLCPKSSAVPDPFSTKKDFLALKQGAGHPRQYPEDLKNLSLLSALSRSEMILNRLKRKMSLRMQVATFLVLLSCGACAQTAIIEPLKIGDKLPEAVLNASFLWINQGSKVADGLKLNQYKDKIVLLDFWASWCSTCIYKFPLLEQLQQKYKNDLVVILVDSRETKDTPERISGILTGAKAPFQKISLPTIYGDTLLTKIFPHRYLPHYVWFGKDGTLKMISSAELLNAETVNALLYQPLKTPQKQ